MDEVANVSLIFLWLQNHDSFPEHQKHRDVTPAFTVRMVYRIKLAPFSFSSLVRLNFVIIYIYIDSFRLDQRDINR